MSLRKFVSSLLLVSTISLALAACETYGPIPTGYTYHGQKYKSPPGLSADEIGYEYDAEKNQQILEHWHSKAVELLNDMERGAQIQGHPIYVRAPHRPTAQTSAFDTSLRDEMRKRGYEIVSDRYDGKILAYYIFEPGKAPIGVDTYNYNDNLDHDKALRDYAEGQNYAPMIIELSLYNGKTLEHRSGGVFMVPMYGYERDYGGNPLYKTILGQKPLTDDEKEQLQVPVRNPGSDE